MPQGKSDIFQYSVLLHESWTFFGACFFDLIGNPGNLTVVVQCRPGIDLAGPFGARSYSYQSLPCHLCTAQKESYWLARAYLFRWCIGHSSKRISFYLCLSHVPLIEGRHFTSGTFLSLGFALHWRPVNRGFSGQEYHLPKAHTSWGRVMVVIIIAPDAWSVILQSLTVSTVRWVAFSFVFFSCGIWWAELALASLHYSEILVSAIYLNACFLGPIRNGIIWAGLAKSLFIENFSW